MALDQDPGLESLFRKRHSFLLVKTGSQLWAVLPPGKQLPMSGAIFGRHIWIEGFTGIPVEACKAVKHPEMHRTAPATKNYIGQKAGGIKIEKPWIKNSRHLRSIYCVSDIVLSSSQVLTCLMLPNL